MSFRIASTSISEQPLSAHDYSFFLNSVAKDRILIVDDEIGAAVVRQLFVRVATIAAKRRQPRKRSLRLPKTEFALVITDMIMPGLQASNC
jgi:PleD family two-component response regulator